MAKELKAGQLRRRFDLKSLGIKNTKSLKPIAGIIGQKRAVKALHFGLEIQHAGYNIYLAGPPGIGKMTAVQSFLEERAQQKETPPDWCYIHNFADPYQPRVCELPAGLACRFQADMKHLIEHIRADIPKAFDSEDYRRKRESITKAVSEQEAAFLKQLNQEANEAGFAIQPTPTGIMIVPLNNGEPVSAAEFQAMPEERKEELQKEQKAIQGKLKTSMKRLRKLERTAQQRLKELDQRIALYVVEGLIDDMMENYQQQAAVVEHLKEVQKDILENIETFKDSQSPSEEPQLLAEKAILKEIAFQKYQVNVLVDNCNQQGAPVVVELNPNYSNLFGRMEKETRFGTLHTDFTLIKSGSMHRANGGFLVLPVEDLLRNPGSWESLKRALQNSEIQIEEIVERLGLMPVKSMRPQPVPLDIKVILVGRPYLYYLMHGNDEEFPELVKVKADFDTQMTLNDENIQNFLGFLASFRERESLKHLDRSAIEKLLEHSARTVEDQNKLSTHFALIADVIREANFWADEEKAKLIADRHIRRALDEKTYRSNLVEEHLREMITRGTILIDSSGAKIGQVNGLSVLSLGEYQFGRPGRITVSVGPGRGGILDLEREVKLGGPIHSKGVMILAGYLAWKFAAEKPITMSARLVFEQSYGGIDGDSASSTELYAILSALAGLPINQGIAVTGSVSQHGEVQAIGGANQKIEGFFDVCSATGLTGQQGVMIPYSNVQNLMLREDVVAAVKSGKFHIWAVKTIDEGIEVLTGVPAGKLAKDGTFPQKTVNYLVDQRLAEFSRSLNNSASDDEKK